MGYTASIRKFPGQPQTKFTHLPRDPETRTQLKVLRLLAAHIAARRRRQPRRVA